MDIKDSVIIVKTDKFNKKHLGSSGCIVDIVTQKDGNKIYDVCIKNVGLVTFLESQLKKIKNKIT